VEQRVDHRELMAAAIERDGEGQRALLAGDTVSARAAFSAASDLYRRSWEAAPSGAFGRLVGMLKSAVLADGGEREAEYVRGALAGGEEGSPTASYALAIAALIDGDDGTAKGSAALMRHGSEAFARAADAIASLCERDEIGYAVSIKAIVSDFEARPRHLTAVPIADTALMLERLARRRGIKADVESPLLPGAPS
jgi:hypothetical protein